MNEQLWLGHFEMWSGSGLIVFRHSTILDAREGEGLAFEQAEAIVEACGRGVRALLPGLPVRPVGRQVAQRSNRRGAH